jgi:hypothetical protein
MLPSPSIDQLAAAMRRRCEDRGGAGPYILLLGEGCAEAAGVPSRAEVARRALAAYFEEPGEKLGRLGEDQLFDLYAKHTHGWRPSKLGRMLRSLYASVPVPSFYQHLASIVREGFFPIILTMNSDTLLEQALANAGLGSSGVHITVFGAATGSQPEHRDISDSAITHIVKLHGDLARDAAPITPDEIDRSLRAGRAWIKDLRGDLIMVEHRPGSDIVDRWLSYSPDRELWWVSSKESSEFRQWTNGEPMVITGEMGRPQLFFQQLGMRLLHSTPEETDEEAVGGRSLESARESPMADSLWNELLRSQSVLYSLDQEARPSDRPQQVQVQIDYQKKHISRLEDRIRSLPEERGKVLSSVQRIVDCIEDHGPGILERTILDDVSAFAASQRDIVEQELSKEQPNQILVSASLGATLAIADRLFTEYGPKLVSAEDVRGLASLVPSAAGKVVL